MLSEEKFEKVRALASQVAQSEACLLYDVEFNGRTLCVFIDKEGGVGIQDCSNVSNALNVLLDAEDPIPGAYDLEVSTPGLERGLRLPWHFEKAVGKKIWVRTMEALEAYGCTNTQTQRAKQISEVLVSFENGVLEFSLEDEKLQIPLAAVEKAKMVFEIKKNEKNTKLNKKAKARKS